jgi:Flp pilus assembly pilin Flp
METFMELMLFMARRMVARLARPDHGQDLLEYGLLVALIAIVVLVGMTQLGSTLNAVFWTPIAQNF